ncbi:Spindle pole body component 97 [Porphyridium purpureum]|uniref:Spindle pole body component n=1 Tax=Porphyridium purpureum TaxID=35688 RepID=A0A5J4Z3L5_PORPP|nr:Spindle pole body component 97 [Porphyridium purpureum]|eukprot:POR0480..scf208_2
MDLADEDEKPERQREIVELELFHASEARREEARLSDEAARMAVRFRALPFNAQARFTALEVLNAALGLPCALFYRQKSTLGMKSIIVPPGDNQNLPVSSPQRDSPEHSHPSTSQTGLLQAAQPACQLGSMYLAVKQAAASFEAQHAECAAGTCFHVHVSVAVFLRELLNEYESQVAALEQDVRNNVVSFYSLMIALEQPAIIFEALQDVVRACDHAGSERTPNSMLVLSKLIRLQSKAQPAVSELLKELLVQCAEPLFERVDLSLRAGLVLPDIHRDYFIEESTQKLDGGTASVFSLRKEAVPFCLMQGSSDELAQLLLQATRHSYMIARQSELFADEVPSSTEPLVDQLPASLEPRLLICSAAQRDVHFVLENRIRNWHEYNSGKVLRMLRKKVGIMSALRWMNLTYLMCDGSRVASFLDSCHEELCKAGPLVQLERVRSAFDYSHRVECADLDGEKLQRLWFSLGAVQCVLEPAALLDQLGEMYGGLEEKSKYTAFTKQRTEASGYECLGLRFQASGPLELVLSAANMDKYRLLFRTLLMFKRVERCLLQAWLTLTDRKSRSPNTSENLRAAVLLHRMIQWIQNVLQYVLEDVIEQQWRTCEIALHAARTVEKVQELVGDFLSVCTKQCLLPFRRLIVLLSSLCDLCIAFSAYCGRLHREQDPRSRPPAPSSGAPTLPAVHDFERSFEAFLMRLVHSLNQTSILESDPCMLQLYVRLDFNGYYSARVTGSHAAVDMDALSISTSSATRSALSPPGSSSTLNAM